MSVPRRGREGEPTIGADPTLAPDGGAHRAFVGAVAVTLLGQLTSVAYEIAVAARFGTTGEADALALAFIVPFALSHEITVWIGSAFIPVYLDIRMRHGPAAAGALFSRSARLVVALAALLAAGWVLAAPWSAGLLAGARDPGLSALTVRLFRLFGLLLLLVPVAALLARALEAHGSFVLPAGRQLCWYGGAVAAVVLGSRALGVAAVPVGMDLGLTAYLILLLGGARRRIGGSAAAPPVAHGGERKLARLLPPLVVGSVATWLNVLVERAIAARQGVGSLAALTYAFRILNFPLTLFLLNATAILFPTLVLHAARLERDAVATLTGRALRLTLFFVFPLAALATALAGPFVQVVFERGAFGRASTATTGLAIALYAPGLVALAGVQVLTRSYQALQRVSRMVALGGLVAALNVAAMLLLTVWIGFAGIPLAWTLTAWLHLGVFLYGLGGDLGRPHLAGVGSTALRCGTAAVAAGGAAWVAGGLLGDGPVLTLLAGGAAGIGAYGLLAFGVARAEVGLALGTLRGRHGA